jgi:hypothetical protein
MTTTDITLADLLANSEADPFTRRHLNQRQWTKALALVDSHIEGMALIVAQFAEQFPEGSPVGAVGDAWNAAHDAHDALIRLRADVAWNPRPLPESQRQSWALVRANID